MDYFIGRKNGLYVLASSNEGKPALEPFTKLDPIIDHMQEGLRRKDTYHYGIPQRFGSFEPLSREDVRRLNSCDIEQIIRAANAPGMTKMSVR